MLCICSASGNCVVPRKGITVVDTQWYPWGKGKGSPGVWAMDIQVAAVFTCVTQN